MTENASGKNTAEMPRTNYIFVDFDNVQAIDLDRIAAKPVKVILVLGERNRKLSVDLAMKIHKHAAQVEMVKAERGGNNALDFILAYHVGIRKAGSPDGYFHIVSRDKGFDALIEHLNGNKGFAARHDGFEQIRVLMTLDERIKFLAPHFRSAKTRPRQKKKLCSYIQAQFGRALSESEIDDTIKALVAKKVIAITSEQKIEYKSDKPHEQPLCFSRQ